MLEMRSNVLWCERKCSRFLKHNGDYVISNMSFSQELQQDNQNKMKMSFGELKLNNFQRCSSYHDKRVYMLKMLQSFNWSNSWSSSSSSQGFKSWKKTQLFLTCCRLLGVHGKRVDTWNMISRPWNCVYTECSPVESSVNQIFRCQESSENGYQDNMHWKVQLVNINEIKLNTTWEISYL